LQKDMKLFFSWRSHALIKGSRSVIKGNFEQLCDSAISTFINSGRFLLDSHIRHFMAYSSSSLTLKKLSNSSSILTSFIHLSLLFNHQGLVWLAFYFYQVKSPAIIMEWAWYSLHRKWQVVTLLPDMSFPRSI
jgi:hypothetical protein